MRVKTTWVAGGSGLVGGELLQLLLGDDDFETVISVGRRQLPLQGLKLRQTTVDFAAPDALAALAAPDAAFCCLGTTIKRAGSREAFHAVDHDAVVAFAKAARDKGARVFLHVTALGADVRSSVFYNMVKGEVEATVAALGFPSVYALRPSILDGEREESRPIERVGLAIGRALGPLLGKYRPTPASAVAAALVASCKRAESGVHVLEGPELRRFAR
jgi:uncharacterized protein YbjT (DUF2867 family)